MSTNHTVTPMSQTEWQVPQQGRMRVPGYVIADQTTIDQLLADESAQSQWSALQQIRDVASLPGITRAAIALPDVHPGYGFPIGGVGAFDLSEGVVVVGGVGFDINCGVRLLATPFTKEDLSPQLDRLGERLFNTVPAGLGAQGNQRFTVAALDDLLREGAEYLVQRGQGLATDLEYLEDGGRLPNANPSTVSARAKQRQFRQIGTLGSGNHYLEIQVVDRILEASSAEAYGLFEAQVVISIHTGSRALGHQIGQDYLKTMSDAADKYGIDVPTQELVCAPIDSDEGQRYLSAIACGANCAFANRQMIAHLVRAELSSITGASETVFRTVIDVGHNNARIETHCIEGVDRDVLVHRKGATRAFGPGRAESPPSYRRHGHPIVVGGTMGTSSYVLRGTEGGMVKTFGSGIHGAGRALSRKKAAKKYWGETIASELASQGIRLWAHAPRSIAEEAPGAYKDVEQVVGAATAAGITQPVARLRPLAVIKG